MRCERVRFLYEEYSTGALRVATMARMEEHLAACPPCREFFEQSDLIARRLRRASEVAHPGPQYFENLNSRVLAHLDAPEAAQPARDPAEVLLVPAAQWRRPLWWAGSLAAAALVALGLAPELTATIDAPLVAQPKPGLLPRNFTMASNLTGLPSTQPGAHNLLLDPTGAPGGAELLQNGPSLALLQLNTLPHFTSGSLNKGTSGIQNNNPEIEQMIASAGNGDGKSASTTRDKSLSGAERRASEDAQVKLTALQPKNPQKELPPEIFEQIQALKTQLATGGLPGLRRNLRHLDEIATGQMVDPEKLSALPVVKQARLYLEAEDALTAGRADDAFKLYWRVRYKDEASPLALRATLQMADICYSEHANFREATDYYQSCKKAAPSDAFTASEHEHIDRQLARLDQFKAGNWQSLQLLHAIQRNDWPEVTPALRGLLAQPASGPLLSEAASTVVDRMKENQADAATTMGLYNLLAKRSEEEQNVDIRAWLDLALGDLANAQLRDPAQARERYQRVITEAESSGAAKLARTKQIELRELNLSESVRNRN